MRASGRGLAAVLSAALSGCATLPPLHPHSAILVRDVVERVQCELRRAAEDLKGKKVDLTQWHGEFQLTLKVQQHGNVDADVSALTVVTRGTITPGFNLGFETISTRSVTLSFNVKFSDVRSRNCDDILKPARSARPGIAGDLGIWDGLKQSMRELDHDDPSSITGIGTYVEFEVTEAAGAKASFQFAHPSGGAGLKGSHTSTNTLVAGFSPNPGPTEPTEVIIVGRSPRAKIALPGGDPRPQQIIQNQIFQNISPVRRD